MPDEAGAPVSAARRLHGRVALITGASRGIGAAVARRFAAEGAAVAVAHAPSDAMASLAGSLVAELRADGSRAVAIPADLATADGPQRAVDDTVGAFGALDIVVANAAATGPGSIDDLAIDEWDHVVAVNMRATWLLVRAARPHLRTRPNGNVITVSSVMAVTGQPGAIHYSASKAGILGLTRSMARELGPEGIRVNAVMPGAIRTESEAEQWPDSSLLDEGLLAAQSLKRRGTADDMSGAFAFLASDDSAFVTGQVICVDGGWVLY